MSVIGSNILAGASGQGGYFLTNSLRFRSSASAYLNRTPASSGNRKTWTWSGWVKRGTLGVRGTLFHAYDGSADQRGEFYFDTSDRIVFYKGGVSGEGQITTVSVFRDPSAWYHVVIKADYSNGTSADRAIIYVNNVAQTVTINATFANADGQINGNWAHSLGSQATGQYLDGYLTEVNFIDGLALTPSSFGETSTSTGVWIPKKFVGTYGTNGFYLKFTDTTSTSTLGTDFSGNSNTWTVNNISLTAGSTYDSMTDVPTLTSTTAGNYWTLNPLNTGQLGTIQSGNLEWIGGDQNNFRTVAAQALPTSGKYYWEVTPIGGGSGGAFVSGIYIGIMNYASGGTGLFASGARIADTGKDDYVYYNDGRKVNLNSFVSYGNSYAPNDVIGIAIDIDNSKIWFSKNGTWQASGDPAAGTNAAYTTVPFSTKLYAPAMSAAEITNAQKFNFGQRPFAYTPPTGFVALNTFNLPTPTIGATASTTANKYFDSVIWTGDQTNKQIPLNFTADFVWAKRRDSGDSHRLYDVIRGINKDLQSNATDAEQTNDFGLDFDNGNYLAIDGTKYFGGGGGSGITFVAWNWKGNGTGVTNTAGTITSTVSANTSAGFSIVTYTGSGSAATVGHGLGVAPSMIIVKDRDNGTYDWNVYHASLSSPTTLKLYLNLSDAENNGGTNSGTWNSTAPTSTVFSLGTFLNVNKSGDKFVAYCFAPVAGYSAFGSYTGNGSSDGTFVFLGFKPKFILVKLSSSGGEDWVLSDGTRDPINVVDSFLAPNSSSAEATGAGAYVDYLSNGFKVRTDNPRYNASGSTYIYMAFAETPQKFALGR